MGATVELHVSVSQWLPGKAFKLGKRTKNCRQQSDAVQHLPCRKRKQDTFIPTTKSLSEQHLAKSWRLLLKTSFQKKNHFLEYFKKKLQFRPISEKTGSTNVDSRSKSPCVFFLGVTEFNKSEKLWQTIVMYRSPVVVTARQRLLAVFCSLL